MAESRENTEQPQSESREVSVGPPIARVRDDDLEPHDALRYVAKLFKALALLLIFMLIAEVIIGLQQDGVPALGMLLVEATRLIVFAGFLWAAGDMAVLLIESNHDLRASRILLGRLNGKMERLLEHEGAIEPRSGAGQPATRTIDAPAGRTTDAARAVDAPTSSTDTGVRADRSHAQTGDLHRK